MSALELYQYRVTLSVLEKHEDKRGRIYDACVVVVFVVVADSPESAVEEAVSKFDAREVAWPGGHVHTHSLRSPSIQGVYAISKHAVDYHPSWDKLPVGEINMARGYDRGHSPWAGPWTP